jgi:predicted RNase H-like HicB family nuclease
MRILIINREPLVIMANKMREFDVVLMEDETGGYVALVPALPGCHTQGETLEETLENVKEAIGLYMETLTEKERKELLKQKVVGIQKVKALA